MPFVPEQLPVLAVWAASLGAAALLAGLLALVGTTRSVSLGGRPLVWFMRANAGWSLGIAAVMLPMTPLPRSLVFHAIWMFAALTSGLWIRAVLGFIDREDRLLEGLSRGLLGLAALILLDAGATLVGAGLLTELAPMKDPGLMVRAAGNQVSFLPAAAVVGSVWGLAVLLAAVLLFRQVRRAAPQERLLLAGIALTGVVSVADGATATLEYAVALSFAANLVEAIVLTAAQIRRVTLRLAEVEHASQQQQSRLTEQLAQMRDLQRLSVLGAQTARITHDLRNPLTAVVAGVELLRDKLLDVGAPEAEVEELTELTTMALDRTLHLASGVTRSLRKADAPEIFEVAGCVDDAILLCSQSLEAVEVSKECAPARVRGQPGELTQVLVNLLQNAAEAQADAEARSVKLVVALDDDDVVIDVEDGGARPADALVDQMFRVPFTTKGDGGTGLGLEICRHVIEGMAGTIRVDPTAANTTIRIRIPQANAPRSSPQRRPPSPSRPRPGRGGAEAPSPRP